MGRTTMSVKRCTARLSLQEQLVRHRGERAPNFWCRIGHNPRSSSRCLTNTQPRVGCNSTDTALFGPVEIAFSKGVVMPQLVKFGMVRLPLRWTGPNTFR